MHATGGWGNQSAAQEWHARLAAHHQACIAGWPDLPCCVAGPHCCLLLPQGARQVAPPVRRGSWDGRTSGPPPGACTSLFPPGELYAAPHPPSRGLPLLPEAITVQNATAACIVHGHMYCSTPGACHQHAARWPQSVPCEQAMPTFTRCERAGTIIGLQGGLAALLAEQFRLCNRVLPDVCVCRLAAGTWRFPLLPWAHKHWAAAACSFLIAPSSVACSCEGRTPGM
jgi:hypothetical protein